MTGKTTTDNDIIVPPTLTNLDRRRSSRSNGKSEKKPSVVQKMLRFLYDPRKKTVLGRGALNWGKYNERCLVSLIQRFVYVSF